MVLSQFRVSHTCTIRIAGIPSAKKGLNETCSMRIKLKLISALRRALAGLSLDELTLRIRAIGAAAPGCLTGCHSLTRAICRHGPLGGSYGVYPAATAKVENISWICPRFHHH